MELLGFAFGRFVFWGVMERGGEGVLVRRSYTRAGSLAFSISLDK